MIEGADKYYQLTWINKEEDTQHCRVIAKDEGEAKVKAASFHDVSSCYMLCDEIDFGSGDESNTMKVLRTGGLAI